MATPEAEHSTADDAAEPEPTPRSGPTSGGARPPLRNAVGVFHYPHFSALFASSAFGFGGMQMEQVARALLAWYLTESFAWTGAIMLAFGLPMAAFSLIGGAMADRVEKRNLLLMTQGVTATIAAITTVLVFTDLMTIEILFGLGLIQGTFFALGMPARTPLMAEVVGREDIASAIAVSNAAMNGSRLVGPAVAGVIVATGGLAAAFLGQSLLFFASAALLLRVPTGIRRASTGPARPRDPGGMFSEVGRGLSYVGHHPQLRILVAMMFITTLFAMPHVTLLAGFVQEDLGQSESAFGYLQSVSGLGALTGSLAIAFIARSERKPLVQWIAGITAGAGLILLALGSAQFGFAAALVVSGVLGLTLTAYQTINMTLVMETADPEYYGRVMSMNMLTFSAMPLMSAPLGLAADAIGASEIFIIMGVIVATFMVLVALLRPRHTFGRHPRPDRPPTTGGTPTTAPSRGTPR
jgi:predicted MFS family arabinose efflux permease